MDDVKIHTGTRVKLKSISEEHLPSGFLQKLKEFAHAHEIVQAIYLFAIQPEGEDEAASLVIAVSPTLFGKVDERFIAVVDEIQIMLPDELPLNVYRFGASDLVTRYCLESLEPVYLRTTAWLEKQRRKYS